MNALKRWMQAATTQQVARLAKLAKTTPGTLQQIAGGHRNASADLAGRIEQASETIYANLWVNQKRTISPIARTDLCGACKRCPYPKRES